MPTALRRLTIKHVSLVDRPANQGANVVLAKRDAEPDLSDLSLTTEQAEAVEKAARKRKTGGTGMAMGMQDRNDPDNDGDDDTGKPDDDEGAAMGKRDFSAEERRRMADNHQALPNGSYPIATRADLENAIHAIGRGNAPHSEIKAHIIRRARALGATSMLPEAWSVSKSNTNSQETHVTEFGKASLPERATDANPDPDNDGDDDRTAAGDTDNSHFNSDGTRKPTMKADDTAAVTKADLDSIRKQHEAEVSELRKSLDETTARAIESESVAKAERDARETREAIAKAEREYALLPGTTPTETGTLLREITKLAPAETVAKLEAILKAASVAVAKGDLFAEHGSTGNAGGTDSAYDKIQSVAKGIREKLPELTQQQAVEKAIRQSPDLAAEYRSQFAPSGGYRQYR